MSQLQTSILTKLLNEIGSESVELQNIILLGEQLHYLCYPIFSSSFPLTLKLIEDDEQKATTIRSTAHGLVQHHKTLNVVKHYALYESHTRLWQNGFLYGYYYFGSCTAKELYHVSIYFNYPTNLYSLIRIRSMHLDTHHAYMQIVGMHRRMQIIIEIKSTLIIHHW